MLNFLSNAIKFSTKKSKVKVIIKIRDIQFIEKCENEKSIEVSFINLKENK